MDHGRNQSVELDLRVAVPTSYMGAHAAPGSACGAFARALAEVARTSATGNGRRLPGAVSGISFVTSGLFEHEFAPKIAAELRRYAFPILEIRSRAQMRRLLIFSRCSLNSRSMPHFETNHVVKHSAEQMFALVADVGAIRVPAPLRSAERTLTQGARRQGAAACRHDRGIQGDPGNIHDAGASQREERIIDVNYIEGPFKLPRQCLAFRAL